MNIVLSYWLFICMYKLYSAEFDIKSLFLDLSAEGVKSLNSKWYFTVCRLPTK